MCNLTPIIESLKNINFRNNYYSLKKKKVLEPNNFSFSENYFIFLTDFIVYTVSLFASYILTN